MLARWKKKKETKKAQLRREQLLLLSLSLCASGRDTGGTTGMVKRQEEMQRSFFFLLPFCNPCVAYTSHEHSHLRFRLLTSPSLLCSALKKQQTNKNGIGTAPATVPR